MLDVVEREKMWTLYKSSGNLYARDQLILHYHPLVLKVAARVGAGLPQHVDQADLEGHGIFGLMDAIEKFDPERGFKFETYAVNRIRGTIIDELRKLDWVPRSVRAKTRLVLQSKSKLENEMGRTPDYSEIAEEAGLTLKEVEGTLAHMRTANMSTIGVSSQYDEGDEIAFDVASIDTPTPFEFDEIVQSVSQSIGTMNDKERIVWTLFYFEQLTLNDIGKVLGVTESRVCQILTKAVLHSRTNLSSLVSG